MTLATLGDYITRHGAPDDAGKVEALLGDASSLVRQYAGHLSLVTDDPVVLDGDGTRRLFLPEIPVVEVTAVTVDGELLDTAAWQVWEWGGLDRIDGRVWPAKPQIVAAIYTHGDDVPAWVVNLVCSMVQRAVRPEAAEGIAQQSTGGQGITYVTSAAGVSLWLTKTEVDRLTALRGEVLA